MKRKIYKCLLTAEALACMAFCILHASLAGIFSTAMAFPFEQIGLGLRTLSLSGRVGNAAAIAIYFAVSLLPAAALPMLRKKRKLYREDGLLVLLCAVLFAVLYIMVNPGAIGALAGGGAGWLVEKAMLGSMVYSIICGYFILRALRLFFDGSTGKLVRYMSVMLGLLNVLFVYAVFGACFSGMFGSMSALQAGNAGNEHLLGTSYVFIALQFVVNALPYVFNMLVVFAAQRLLDEMRKDRYSAETVAAAGQIARLCAAALVAVVLANVGFNLLQLIFAKSLMVVNSLVQIPVFSIAFVLAALLFARLVTENKQLKDESDMFI